MAHSLARLTIVALALLSALPAWATLPFRYRDFASPSGKAKVSLMPYTTQAIEVVVNGKKVGELGLESLSADYAARWADKRTTAGTRWYGQVMGFFSEDESTFYLFVETGSLFAVDMSKGQAHPVLRLEKAQVADQLAALARRWITSEDSTERLAATRAAGLLRLKDLIPRLRELLTDTSRTATYPIEGVPWYEFPIREAALNSLKAMGVNAEAVIRTPIPKGERF